MSRSFIHVLLTMHYRIAYAFNKTTAADMPSAFDKYIAQ